MNVRPDGRKDFCGFESDLRSMGEVGDFCPEEAAVAVGSRRSRAAAFGDETIDESIGFENRTRDSCPPDDVGTSTFSGTTAGYSDGEQLSSNSPSAQRTLPRGS